MFFWTENMFFGRQVSGRNPKDGVFFRTEKNNLISFICARGLVANKDLAVLSAAIKKPMHCFLHLGHSSATSVS